MVSNKCKKCTKFVTNDCKGLSQLNRESCEIMLRQRTQDIDVSGCC
ncbi:MAG: hypothetical protein PWQ67_2199 [Clostridia bacterium]|jgi:hypothetical protein|nr:hypothetical protein [Clostridia bacterium]MDN5323745.1 hypothetical protein [Clostridia bacterium]